MAKVVIRERIEYWDEIKREAAHEPDASVEDNIREFCFQDADTIDTSATLHRPVIKRVSRKEKLQRSWDELKLHVGAEQRHTAFSEVEALHRSIWQGKKQYGVDPAFRHFRTKLQNFLTDALRGKGEKPIRYQATNKVDQSYTSTA